MMIFLVNATSYKISIPSEAFELRKKYFRVKNYAKIQKIRNINPENNKNTRTYAVGLLRIATLLRFNGYNVKYIDLEEFNEEYICNNVENRDMVAFSAVTPTIPKCASLCDYIKRLKPEIITGIGGSHINIASDLTQKKYNCFDRYAVGFDTIGVSNLLGTSPESLRLPPYYVDYSILPLPLSQYVLNTFSTLGCIYNCDYCQDHMIPYLENPDMTGLAAFLGKVPKGSMVHFFDSVLGVIPKRTKEVCSALSKIDHGLLLSCDARAEVVTPEYVKMLESAGFVEISLGMETTDDNVLRANNRFLTSERLIQAFETIRRHSNLYISVYNAIGIPGNTIDTIEKSIEETEKLLLDDYIDEVKSGIYVPYPMDGKDYESRGVIIEDDDWSHYDRQSFPVYRLKEMTSQQIWNGSVDFLSMSVNAWLKKLGFSSISELPDVYWHEYFEALHIN